MYAVVIGVSDYADASMALRYAAKDASDLGDLLQKRKGNVKVLRLTDKAVTKEAVAAAKAHFMQSKVDDDALFFVAGHGLLDNKLDWYFATHDVDFAAPDKRGVSYESLEKLLDGIPARKRLLLMDACHSGEVDKSESVLVAAANGPVSSPSLIRTRLQNSRV